MHRGLTGLVAVTGLVAGVSVAVVVVEAQRVTPRVDRVDYDMRALVEPAALSDTELEGRRLFIQQCAFCHGQRGAINLGAERVASLGEARFREAVDGGLERQMPGFRYSLNDAQVGQIIAFLQTVTNG